jgi:hypothetical protein
MPTHLSTPEQTEAPVMSIVLRALLFSAVIALGAVDGFLFSGQPSTPAAAPGRRTHAGCPDR